MFTMPKLPVESVIGTAMFFNNGGMYIAAKESRQWEHVSAAWPDRCPTWEEMCDVKRLFWDDEDIVIQYHPRASRYLNIGKYALHLWRPKHVELPEPDIADVSWGLLTEHDNAA